jgi:FkbM family methyltransferase
MLKKIKKILGYYLLKEKIHFVNLEIAGFKLRGVKGTERKKPDQDDAWFFELAKHHKVIYDIGANIGYMALLAAIQPNNERIVLVDPNPEALSKAAQNLIINGFGIKCNFIPSFIGNRDGESIKFYTVGSGEAGSIYPGHAQTASLINSFYYVNQLTIDSLVEQLHCFPDLIKIDIEGAEYLALEGAIKTASYFKTTFMIEMHSPPELPMNENAKLIMDWCNRNDYKPFYMRDGVELKESIQIAQRGKCHLLLIPNGNPYPNYLKNINQSSSISFSSN